MRIFLSFLQSNKKHSIPAYDFWERYIKNGIQEGGHQWIECPGADWAEGLVSKSKSEQATWKQDIWEKTVNWLKKNPADLFLSYLYPEQIDQSAIKEIKKTGIPCVNFFCDNVREFKSIPSEFKIFDLNWVPEYKAIPLYKKARYPFINLPMPMWVDPQYRVLKEETNNQVTFIGSMDIQRKLLFEKFISNFPDVPLAIYGNGWKQENTTSILVKTDISISKKVIHQFQFIGKHGITPYLRKIDQRNSAAGISDALNSRLNLPPASNEYNLLTAGSMITLGVNRYPSFRYPVNIPDSYSRLRDVEAPMLGACYLTEWTEGIDLLYDTNEEIAVYRNTEELAFKIKELQADKTRRKKLKINGQKRALQNHTIPYSLNEIMCTLKL